MRYNTYNVCCFTWGLLGQVFAEGDRYAGYFDMNWWAGSAGHDYFLGCTVLTAETLYRYWCIHSRSGYGEYQWSDGRRYRGTWRNDVMHGSGELLTPSDVRAQRGALLRSADTSW